MSLPYFPFYPGDWLSSTRVRSLTLEERGAYLELLCNMWGFDGGCYLPDDDERLARIVGANAERWQSVRYALVDGPFAVLETDGKRVTNKRLLEEWEKATNKSQRASESAKKRPKAANAEPAQGDGTANAPANAKRSHQPTHSYHRSQISEEEEEEDRTRARETPPAPPSPITDGVLAWRKWYEKQFGGKWPRNDWAGVMDSAINSGMNPAVVIGAIERGVKRRRGDPLSWGAGVVGNMLAAGILTQEDALEYWRQQDESGGQNERRRGSDIDPGPPGKYDAWS